MARRSIEELGEAIRAIESELGLRYPPTAAALLVELAAILERGASPFGDAHLLTTAAAVAAERDESGRPLYDGCLIPFLRDEQSVFPDVYGFVLRESSQDRVGVYSVHTIVKAWPSTAAFITWVDKFASSDRLTLH